MFTKDDIYCHVNEGKMLLEVIANGETYGVTAIEGAEVMAVDLLIDQLMEKVLGVTKHDLLNIVSDAMIKDLED